MSKPFLLLLFNPDALAFLLLYWLHVYFDGHPIAKTIPSFVTLTSLAVLILLEQFFHYEKGVSQKRLALRDIASTAVNVLFTGSVMRIIFVPLALCLRLNLAATDVKYLSQALIEHYLDKSDAGIDHYSERCLARVWKAERFSWWMTMLLHNFPDMTPFEAKMLKAERDYLFSSQAALTALAENYVGLPY